MAKSWKDLFKSKDDVKKKIRGATGQKEPKDYGEEGEVQRRIRKANEEKNKKKALKKLRDYGN